MLSRLTPLVLALAAAGCSAPAPEANAVGDANSADATTDAAVSKPTDTPDAADPTASGVTADTPVTSGNYARVMEARSREYDRLEYKPVTLNGFTSGDNAYLELTRAVEGSAPETILCTAAACADWRDAGALPATLRDKGATAKFGTADQVDGAGTVMKRGVPAVVDLRIPAGRRKTAAKSSSGDTGSLPLTAGVYVIEGGDCRNPANASFRVWNGRGLSGSATKDCRATVLSRDGESYTLRNSCVNTYDGSRTPETLTMRVSDQARFAVDGNRFRSCSMAEVPDSLRKRVR